MLFKLHFDKTKKPKPTNNLFSGLALNPIIVYATFNGAKERKYY